MSSGPAEASRDGPPQAQAHTLPRAPTVCGRDAQAALCPVCARSRASPSVTASATRADARIVKIFERAFLLELTPRPPLALWLVFRSTLTHTQRQEGWHWLRGNHWTGNTCWRTSRGLSIRHCYCAMSTW